MNLSTILSAIVPFALLQLASGQELRGARSLPSQRCSLPSLLIESSENSQFRGSFASWDSNPVSDEVGGSTIAASSGHCVVLPGGVRYNCLVTFEIEGMGNIILQGFESATAEENATIGIVGGTGCYVGITGSYQVQANIAYDTFTYTLD